MGNDAPTEININFNHGPSKAGMALNPEANLSQRFAEASPAGDSSHTPAESLSRLLPNSRPAVLGKPSRPASSGISKSVGNGTGTYTPPQDAGLRAAFVASDLPYPAADHQGSKDANPSPPRPIRMIVTVTRTVSLTYHTTVSQLYRPPTTVAKAVASTQGQIPTSFITVTVSIVSIQHGGYTAPTTSSCETTGGGTQSKGPPGVGSAGGPNDGPVATSGIIPPISYTYSPSYPVPVTISQAAGRRTSAFLVFVSAFVLILL